MIDDLTGDEITDGGQTLTFGLSGLEYSIDLSAENTAKFKAELEPYVKAADRVTGRPARGSARASSSSVDSRAVRVWAESNGVAVSARGRIPSGVMDQYRAAGN